MRKKEKLKYTTIFPKSPEYKRKYKYIVTARRFYSDADIIRELHKEEQTRLNQLPEKHLDVSEFKVSQNELYLSRFNKAMILARKYRRHHFILRQLSSKRSLSEKQIDLILKITDEVKKILKRGC